MYLGDLYYFNFRLYSKYIERIGRNIHCDKLAQAHLFHHFLLFSKFGTRKPRALNLLKRSRKEKVTNGDFPTGQERWKKLQSGHISSFPGISLISIMLKPTVQRKELQILHAIPPLCYIFPPL